MSTVASLDGTPIAFERSGTGPPVILIGGGLDDGAENAPLAADFTTYNYARRGRAGSGDTQPYAVARELEDIAALIAAVPRARRVTLPAQGHVADPAVLAAALREFFSGR